MAECGGGGGGAVDNGTQRDKDSKPSSSRQIRLVSARGRPPLLFTGCEAGARLFSFVRGGSVECIRNLPGLVLPGGVCRDQAYFRAAVNAILIKASNR